MRWLQKRKIIWVVGEVLVMPMFERRTLRRACGLSLEESQDTWIALCALMLPSEGNNVSSKRRWREGVTSDKDDYLVRPRKLATGQPENVVWKHLLATIILWTSCVENGIGWTWPNFSSCPSNARNGPSFPSWWCPVSVIRYYPTVSTT